MAKSRKYISKKRSKKYFLGGLLVGGLGLKALKKAREEKEAAKSQEGDESQDRGGKILKVKVIGEGGGGNQEKGGLFKQHKEGLKGMKGEKDPAMKERIGSAVGGLMKEGGIAKKYAGGGTFHSYDSNSARKNVDQSNKPRTFNWKGYFKGEQGYFPDIKGKTTKQTVDENKDTVQKYADRASYIPGPVGKGAGFVSAGIDSYDAYNAYQAGDMDTYHQERNKAITTALLSGTPGNIVKAPIKSVTKSGLKTVAPKMGEKAISNTSKAVAVGGKNQIKEEVKDTVSTDEFVGASPNINTVDGNPNNRLLAESKPKDNTFQSNRGNWQGPKKTDSNQINEKKNEQIVDSVKESKPKEAKDVNIVEKKDDSPKAKKGAIVRKPRKHVKKKPVTTLESDYLYGAGVSYDKSGTNKMKRMLKNKEEEMYRKTGKTPPKRNIFEKGAVVNEMNDKEGYKSWKKNTSTRTKENISPKVDRKAKINKHYEENVDPDSKQAIRKAKYVENRNLKGTTANPGNQELLLEPKKGHLRGDIKKKGPVRGLFNRKTEKGLVKKKYDDTIYEDSEVIPGARADKFYFHNEKEERKAGREQRKYVQSGSDHEGDPIKTKEKIKGVKGRDIPTEKHKQKMINENERKYVSVVDGKRIKRRGANEEDARQYTRRGFRRTYVEPDAEGNVQYVGTGERATRRADREDRKAIKAENKNIRKQKKQENKARRKQERQEFRKNFSDPGRYNDDNYYKKGGKVRKYIMCK